MLSSARAAERARLEELAAALERAAKIASGAAAAARERCQAAAAATAPRPERATVDGRDALLQVRAVSLVVAQCACMASNIF